MFTDAAIGRMAGDVTDELLAVAARKGDRTAFTVLVGRYRDLAFAYTYAHLGSREDAEDVVQSAFVSAYQALDRFRESGCWGAWMMQIVRNRCRDALRRRRARPVQPLTEDRTDPAPSPESTALEEERRSRLLAAVGDLPEPQRIPLLMHYGSGQTCREIALALQLPESTVKGRLTQAVRKVRQRLSEEFA